MDREKDKIDTKPIKYSSIKDMGLVDPEQRLKVLSDYGSSIEIDKNIQARKYFRSGVEMLRMAEVYMDEGSLENAYTLYMKFVTIFVEKIRNHPQYGTVPTKDRVMNQQALREVLPKAEALKKQLLEQYRLELAKYLHDAEEREKIEEERLKKEELQRLKEEEERKNKIATQIAAKAAKVAINAAAITLGDESKSKKIYPMVSKSYAAVVSEDAQSSLEKKTPMIDRSTKPSMTINSKYLLRDMIVPNRLMQEFLTLAFNNTVNNKETCGVLAGKLERNKLLVTHLLIPKQTGSPDSCITHNEEDIFDYQDQHNLITLGWIHTHPTQTAFLSSVDLHTHCAYQLMMAEAVAVVCAPKYDETGLFTLTPDYGLDFIASCRESGFHPHPSEPPLYTKANHCKLDPLASVVVVDLRKK
ncbi:STAM-binding protein-like A [Orussus abietinus]|uniref:STAM-binding protein-like A n=1 Tax=Orussus abietinus TaxID=222816 RepID=UPI000625F3CC|nr:STAM-binding protein-like A [Orussus abietinus]XP_012283984.1 STAM-binding protein-like A [Orussus abietinus]XP_012283985.1 STAM-binding protein-like A [Orussus abietinus]XP_012283986.1 STAM-binding protein-like A [Orussus abietinus]XP_012283987.1 STAM-binding protein-like A [Orussus abietinus]XP_012283988.1 STAM-binding protein-like A [Orussus abietinus]XP_012283989.1 STAM-binding protein-like A [Orussus abietinus]XP_012283990.1 STAM-binding protein-like A [Orussus abietinus]XP_01228399